MSYKPVAPLTVDLEAPVAGSDEYDVRPRYHRSGLVGDDAGKFRVGLRKCSRTCQHEEQRQQEEPVFHLSHVTFLFKCCAALCSYFRSAASPSSWDSIGLLRSISPIHPFMAELDCFSRFPWNSEPGKTSIDSNRAGMRVHSFFSYLAVSLLSIRPVRSRPDPGYSSEKATQKGAGLSIVWDKKFRDIHILEFPNSNV